MNNTDTSVIYKTNPDVVFTFIDDEAVLMRPNDDELFGTNPVATEIWKLLGEKPMSIKDISRYITEQFDVDEKQSVVDTKQFLDALLTEGFVIQAK